MKATLFVFVVLVSLAVIPSSLFAQAFEINPYGGYIWPGQNDSVGSFRNNQLLGVRGGYYITPNFELGGNYSWNNHFQPKDNNVSSAFAGELGFPQGTTRGNLWEAEFSYNFGKHSAFGATIRPYITGGAGALITSTKDPSAFVLNVRTVAVITPLSAVITPFGNINTVHFANDTLGSSDTFFTFSYGGGIKAERLLGPMGVFGDVRGRTVPNFFSNAFNWPEVTGGLTFSWGEK